MLFYLHVETPLKDNLFKQRKARMISLIPSDPHQALRIRRFLMAFASYLMWVLIIQYCYSQGIFRQTLAITLGMCVLVVVMNLVLYVVFLTELNKRFKDPSLTMFQMVLGTLWIMIVTYYLDEGRGIMLLLYLVVFIFGTFRLNLRQFCALTVFAITSYGSVIALLLINHPKSVNIRIDLLYLVILFTVLLWFSFIGSYLNILRKKLSKANNELNNAIEHIKQQAIHDDLTGLFNRGHLFTILQREKSLADRGGPIFSLCIFDLDDFKKVNDTYGHLTGDIVLRTLAQRIKGAVRQEDYMARYGGEEFVLVLAYPDLSDALMCANRIRKLASETQYPGLPEGFRVTISMGLTQYQSMEDIDITLKRADDALYRAKRTGKNIIECESPQISRLELEPCENSAT
jgi:diguanylate cyclase